MEKTVEGMPILLEASSTYKINSDFSHSNSFGPQKHIPLRLKNESTCQVSHLHLNVIIAGIVFHYIGKLGMKETHPYMSLIYLTFHSTACRIHKPISFYFKQSPAELCSEKAD